MSDYGWVTCGQSHFLLELFGEIAQPEDPDSDAIQHYKLMSVAGIRVRHYAGLENDLVTHEILQINIEETFLEEALKLNTIDSGAPPTSGTGENPSVKTEGDLGPLYTIVSIHPEGLILEGTESPNDLFLNLIFISGWKLVLSKNDTGAMNLGLYLLGDWNFDTHPDYFPGSPFGEVSFTGLFGTGSSEQPLQLQIPWPFARDARLALGAPTRSNEAWCVDILAGEINSIFDSAGPAFKQFLVGKVDVASLLNAGKDLHLESGAEENGAPFFRVRAPLAGPLEFGGLQLDKVAGSLLLGGVLGATHIAFKIEFAPTAGSTFSLKSPFTLKSENTNKKWREVVSLIPPPVDQIDSPDIRLPNIWIDLMPLEVTQEATLLLAQADIPVRWDSIPATRPTGKSPFDLFSLSNIDASGLVGFSFGALNGNAPGVQLEITKVKSEEGGNIKLSVKLTVQASPRPKDKFTVYGDWRFTLDLQRLAFIPGKSINLDFDLSPKEITATGLSIAGLRSLGVSWENSSLALSATGLRAYFEGISIPDLSDPSRGFEFDISSLKIDSGGLDLELTLAGGVTKVRGIGEAFKGTRGAISIVDSRLVNGFLTAEGPLPHLDNATGSMTLLFKDGLNIDQAKAEFQLGLHRRADWWMEVDLKSVRLEIAPNPSSEEEGDISLIPMITGGVAFKAAEGSTAIAAYLKEARLDFKDLVLTKDFDGLPPGLSLLVELAKPIEITILEAFTFQMRSLGIGPGSDPGQGAINIGGQIFFSSKDLADAKPDFHIFKLQKPDLGSLIPRVALDHLPVRFEYKPSLRVNGFVGLVDTPQRRGFNGAGELVIGDTINLYILLEFVSVQRPSDGKMLRVWMVYAELREVNKELIGGMFLRDVGVGFGWRKTLEIMDTPTRYIDAPSQGSRIYSPHLPSAWSDDLDGDEARWTVVLSAWLTYKLKARDEVTPLVADILLGLRSDLTFFLGIRGWVFSSLGGLRNSSRGGKPAIVGLIYYSMRNRHLLVSVATSPAAAGPEGIPPELIEALGAKPFNFTLETRPGLFRVELGWPRQLTLRLGVWTGWAGMLLRVTNNSLTIGLGFEIGLSFESSLGMSFGFFGFSIYAYGQISVYGEILARIGDQPALFGTIGINAIIVIQIEVWIRLKLGFIRINLSFSIGFELIMTARVSFGIATGFGLEGYVGVSLKVWKFQVGGSVSVAINRGALDEARRRVSEGTSAGERFGTHRKQRQLPQGDSPLPPEADEHPEWTVLHAQRGDKVFVLLLPAQDSWFATPPPVPDQGHPPSINDDYDYKFEFALDGIDLVRHWGNLVPLENKNGNVRITCKCDWAAEIPSEIPPDTNNLTETPSDQAEVGDTTNPWPLQLGDWFSEEPVIYHTLRLTQAILDRYRPELLIDWRVRAEKDAQDEAAAAGARPDVRSPQFSADGGLYDLALEEALGESKDDTLSWERIALGMTSWLRDARSDGFQQYVRDEVLAEQQERRKQAAESGNTQAREIELPPPGDEHMYAAVEQLRRNRNALVSRLLDEFRRWALGEDAQQPGPLLAASGLAFEFAPRAGLDNWSLSLQSLTVRRVYDGVDQSQQLPADPDPAKSQLRNATFGSGSGGLGFQREGYQYRIRDVIEFQAKDGIHFSWQFECQHDQEPPQVISYEELSGMVAPDSCFEFFDHYSVERINITQQARDSAQAAHSVNVRPGFVPSFLDLGSGLKKFFLVAPRFEFSDQFAVPAAVGDLLLYRLTAVDVFGNRSQTLEYLTYRKQLLPPPPPDSARVHYVVQLSKEKAETEQVTISVKPGSDLAKWAGGMVNHEIWARPVPLAAGGYYGLGDDAGDSPGQDRPVIEPRGMMLVGFTSPETDDLPVPDLTVFRYGTLYEFYARTVSLDGNASRLVRCQHSAQITAGALSVRDRPQAYLERIPPPAGAACVWMEPVDMRFELQTATEPRPDPAAVQAFTPIQVDDPSQRELTLRILHHPYTNDPQRHPTGGYLVLARDRDATTGDQPSDYKRLAEIEVVSAERYQVTPHAANPWAKWHGRYLQVGETPAFLVQKASGDGHDLGCLDWGEELDYASMDRGKEPDDASSDSPGLFPEGTRLHVILSEALEALQERATSQGYQLEIHQGRPGPEELSKITYPSLLENHTEVKDPYGSGLLNWLGRSVELTMLNEQGQVIPAQDFIALMTDIVMALQRSDQNQTGIEWSRYQLMLEVLVNGDRRSPMGYYRLSLPPRLRSTPQESAVVDEKLIGNSVKRKDDQIKAFKGFIAALEKAFSVSLPGLPDATRETYEAFTRRFLRQRPLDESPQPRLAVGTAFYEDGGSFSRPLNPDGTIAIQVYYIEQYARRFAYRVQCISRYAPLYRELALWSDDLTTMPGDQQALMARLPRVKLPAAPAASFLGNFVRGGFACSEWIIEAHDEEALVQSNETMRNRLGFRALAWSLFSEVISNWEQWSGWSGDKTWAGRAAEAGLSQEEIATLQADAAWPEPSRSLPPTTGLDAHPFTGLLLPKGMLVRVPKLPYYYRYRLGAFARADDVDSQVRLVEASPAMPSRVAAVDPATAGWDINADGRLEIWWQIPSVWDSLDEFERAMWANEKPFASRLWDFDLQYTLRITRFKGDPVFETITPLLFVRLAPVKLAAPPTVPYFIARTAATHLYWEEPGKVEQSNEIEGGDKFSIESPFLPRLSLSNSSLIPLALNMTDTFKVLAAEFDFVIELHCSRAYGPPEPGITLLERKTLAEATQ